SSKGVDEDAPHQDTTATEQVCEVAADQPEDAARDGGHVLKCPHPRIDGEAVGFRREQFGKRRPDDERQHEQRVGVEGKAEGGRRADRPLQRCKRSRGRAHCGFHHVTSIRRVQATTASKVLATKGTTTTKPERPRDPRVHRGLPSSSWPPLTSWLGPRLYCES